MKDKKDAQDQGMLRFSVLHQPEAPVQFTDPSASLPSAEDKPDEGWKGAPVHMTK